jgi:chromosome segregation ATPase
LTTPRETKKKSRKKLSIPRKTKAKKTGDKSPVSDMASQEELCKLLDEHLGGILILDEKRKIVYANEAAAKLLGKDCSKLPGVRVTKVKSFSEATDQLSWLGKPHQLMVENTTTRRLAKVNAELKKTLKELRHAEKELVSSQRSADDSNERAEEMEGFLEQMEAQRSELEGQVQELKEKEQLAQGEWEQTEAKLVKRISQLEKALKQNHQEMENSNRLRLVAENELETTKSQCTLLSEEVTQLKDSSKSQDSELARKVETLKRLLLQAEEEETSFVGRIAELESTLKESQEETSSLRRIAELESALKESQDEATIAKYDLNEALEKSQATREKLKAAEGRVETAKGRVETAAQELFQAWEAAETAEGKTKEADALREKAEQRTAELERIMEKITPDDDDTILGFL